MFDSSHRITIVLVMLAAASAHACAPAEPVTHATRAPATAARDAEPAARASAASASAPAATPIADPYREVSQRIIEAALSDDGAYQKLAYLTDRIGHRLSGSRSLERAIEWAGAAMKADGHENVRQEAVMVPHWVRGAESAEILSPVARPLAILGLGMTVGTGEKGVEGELLVVRDFDELQAQADRVAGRIVLFDVEMTQYRDGEDPGYGTAVMYRSRGPSAAARLGAKAVLVRSLATHSLRTPHTGGLRYDEDAPKIPAAAVSVEDSALLARLAASGESVRVRLTLGAKLLPPAESANVIAELVGRERPDEIVLIGGHIDSWDVGQGAHDDGGGCVVMMQALTVLRRLNLRPRRTIRVVLFTNEENGLGGGKAYFERHGAELDKHVAAIESDTGVFQPLGFSVQGNDTAVAQMRDILSLLAPLGATRAEPGDAGADIMFLTRAGVPGLGLWPDITHYFDYHHTEADTLDKIDPEHLKQQVAAAAVTAYVLADMPERLGQPEGQAEAASTPTHSSH